MFKLFKDLKLAFQSFKKGWKDYLAISFAFAMIVYIGILLAEVFIGLLLAYVIVIVPAIISLKFCVFQAYDKPTVEYRSLKTGFLTFFKSIRVYFVVILKPLFFGLLAGVLIYSFFLESAIMTARETMPNIIESLANYDTFYYTYEEMLEIDEVGKIMNVGLITSLVGGYLLYFCLKLRRDFIPFMAFEIPINSKRAISMNSKMLEKKRYFKFLLINLIILAMLAVPWLLAYLVKCGLQTNEIYSSTTINLLMILVFVITSAPIIMLKQLHYIHAYKSYSKPFKEDFNNELKNVIKEMEQLAKKIDENNEN